MRHISLFSLAAALVLLTACASSPASRIETQRAVFDTYPSEVQQKIRAGEVAVGFTPEMVLLARGEPDRKSTRKTAAGDTEVWGYHDDNRPAFAFGFGFGSGGRHSSMGGGVGVSTGGGDPEETTQIELRDNRVAAIDSLTK